MRYLLIVVALLVGLVAKADSIIELVTRVSSQPEWRYGIYPTIDLPRTATTNQVAEQVFKTTAFNTDAGIQSVKTFKLLEIRQVNIPASDTDSYTAVLVETDLGRKIAVFRWEQDQEKAYWWSRVYDAKFAEDFHLVQTIAYDDPPPATNSIYVLLLPLHDGAKVDINPVVLKKFDGREIGRIIEGAVKRGFLSSGSVLHIDPSPLMARPPEAEVKILTEYCKKIGITVVVSLTQ
jgi:hypothetical protein